jgi:hypothetical protein
MSEEKPKKKVKITKEIPLAGKLRTARIRKACCGGKRY